VATNPHPRTLPPPSPGGRRGKHKECMSHKKSGGIPTRLFFTLVLRLAILFVALIVSSAGCGSPTDVTTHTPCSFTLSPGSVYLDSSGGKQNFMVNTWGNCAWTAISDAAWVTVIGRNSGDGSGTISFIVSANTTNIERTASIKVVYAGDRRVTMLYQVSQAAIKWLPIRGAYTFVLQVDLDGACGWPVTKFYWPVTVNVTSYIRGTTLGSIVFPTTPGSSSSRWDFSASPTRTQLVPRQDSPGPAGGLYEMVVEGGRWKADGVFRAREGRGEIPDGTANGVKQILTLRSSGRQWECQSDAKWSLLIRYVDPD
jgi:hypothetical protein